MPYKNSKGYLMSIGGNEAEIVSVDEAFNEVVVTWFTLDSDFAKNQVVALDPEYGLTIRFTDDDAAHQAIMDSRYDLTARKVAIIITDLQQGANGSTITFNGVLTSISAPRQLDDIIELDVTVKIESGEPAIVAIP